MAVPLSSLADAVAACNEILSKHNYPFSIFGHVADGNFHCMIITDPSNPNELSDIREITHSLASKIISMNGTCTGEHGIGMGKIESLVEEAGIDSVQLMRTIKRALDPNWILNPGKVISNS
jgi:D-lactate dehydrogenase (cytochrome)